MGTIKQLYDACSSFTIREASEEAVTESGEALLDYNRKQLFEKSENADGENLMSYNGTLYALYKERLNPLPGFGHPDLFLTGAFQRAFELTVKGFTFEVDSTDPKSDELKEKYGETIFGLSPDSKEAYISGEFFEALKQKIESITGLKFT